MSPKLESDPLWVSLQADLLREICHDLRGRAMALRGFAELQNLAEPDAGSAGLRLPVSEVAKVEAVAKDLETVNGPARLEEPELLVLGPEVERAVRAVARLGDRRMTPVIVEPPVGDPSAVRVPPASFRRLVMVALVELGGAAREVADAEVRVRVESGEGEGEVRVALRTSAAALGAPARPDLLVAWTGATWQWRADEDGSELQLAFSA